MIELAEISPREDWDSWLTRFGGGTIFHRRVWLELIADLSRSALRLLAVEERGTPLGLLPVFLFRRGPFRILASPPPLAATPYLGPVVPKERLKEVLAALDHFARTQSVAYLELRLAVDPSAADWGALGFEQEARATHLLDLRPGVESLWQRSLDPACRRAVRKAEREGVDIREARLSEIVDRYYELTAMVFARHDRPPPLSKQDYRRIAVPIEQGATARVLTAEHGNRIVAAGHLPLR